MTDFLPTQTPPLLVIDIGGTWTRCAAVINGQLHNGRKVPTHAPTAEIFVKALLENSRTVLGESLPAAIGVSTIGPVNPVTGTLFTPPNRQPGLVNLPIGTVLAQEFGVDIAVDRDTNCALLGEHRCGAGRGCQDLVFATVSTGLGGAVMVGGALLRGADGVAGELGHLRVADDGVCGCGRTGCLEAVVSGTAIARRAGLASGAEAARAALDGHPGAQAALAQARRALVHACVDWVNLFNPQRIILGGSVVRDRTAWFELANEKVKRVPMEPARSSIEGVFPALLGDQAPLWGAATLAADLA